MKLLKTNSKKNLLLTGLLGIVVFGIIVFLFGFKLALFIIILSLFMILKIDSRYLVLMGLVALVLSAALISFKVEGLANITIVFAYYCLFSGVIFEIVYFYKNPNGEVGNFFDDAKFDTKKIGEFERRNIFDMPKTELIYRFLVFPFLIVMTSLALFTVIGPSTQSFIASFTTNKSLSLDRFSVVEEVKQEVKKEGQPKAEDQGEPKKNADLRIRIENGNGVAGDGGKTAEVLTAKGYMILDEDIVNSDNFDYKTTEIYYKKGNDARAEELKGSLGRSSKTTPGLRVESKYDFLIILGAND